MISITNQHLFKTTNSIHNDTRSSKSLKFLYQSPRLEIQKNAFSRIGVKLWNTIIERNQKEYLKKNLK